MKYRSIQVFVCLMLAGQSVTMIGGCANAIMYGEKGQFGMVLEVDSLNAAAPVSGTIGLKHTVFAIIPENGEPGIATDAASMISQFKLKKEKVEGNPWGRLTIETAFITGDASSKLDAKGVKGAVGALASVMAIPSAGTEVLGSLEPYIANYKIAKTAGEEGPYVNAAEALGYAADPDDPDIDAFAVAVDDTNTAEKAVKLINELHKQGINP